MIPIKRLLEIIEELPEDALAYAHEGEVVGMIFVSADGKELGYIPTKETGSSDIDFMRATAP